MNFPSRRRKCPCCSLFFTPDPHNWGRQLYCGAPACRRASKAASQRRWLGQAANRNYFRDAANVERVRQWRKAHPGYWKRSKSRSKPGQPVEPAALNPETISCNASPRDLVALQDFILMEHPAFVGLISMVTGSTLQADIAAVGRNLLFQGRTILGFESPDKPTADHDSKTITPARPPPPGAAQFQLGGSPSGARPPP